MGSPGTGLGILRNFFRFDIFDSGIFWVGKFGKNFLGGLIKKGFFGLLLTWLRSSGNKVI